ncbi:zinc-binding dehydrogenase [Nitzschia inconspicua]|uniref:Zinc-binding dehydrogenase n=1 Tax=Nitzschia inconspicua TaxID=303405 RepID=A0A9K3PEM7_9STRA|nr:zinc-binding dehydrogenase [Nitzschia inconspicua]KAG7344425.1 zinc-binding dehydrogenase [Nitzschia inconspicua]
MTSSPKPSTFTNQKWILTKRPKDEFDPDRDVELKTEELNSKSCLDGEKDEQDLVLVKVEVLSVDAFIRTMMDATAYHGSLDLQNTLPALGYGTVVMSKSKKFRVGQPVLGMLGAQTYARIPAKQLKRKFDLPLLPTSASLGLLSLTTGLTAYAGIFFVPSKGPRKGDTVVVTASAGAVGSIAAQLAKTTGAKVVGIAGNKNDYLLNELKLDGAVNYKDKSISLEDQLDEACPNGVDFVFDNVGGDTLDALLERIRPGGRIVICGAVSQYDSGSVNKVDGQTVQGPSNYLNLAERGAEMRGFNVMQHMHKMPIAMFFLFWYYVRGKVRMTEHIHNGIESFPKALKSLFDGGNTGKTLVKVKNV